MRTYMHALPGVRWRLAPGSQPFVLCLLWLPARCTGTHPIMHRFNHAAPVFFSQRFSCWCSFAWAIAESSLIFSGLCYNGRDAEASSRGAGCSGGQPQALFVGSAASWATAAPRCCQWMHCQCGCSRRSSAWLLVVYPIVSLTARCGTAASVCCAHCVCCAVLCCAVLCCAVLCCAGAGQAAVEPLHQQPHPAGGVQPLPHQPGRQLERVHRPLAAPL